MKTTRVVIPGKFNPVTVRHVEPLPNGNYRLLLSAGAGIYERIVTERGLCAIDREVLSIPTWDTEESA